MTSPRDFTRTPSPENLLTVAGDFRLDRETTALQFSDGRILRIDTRLLEQLETTSAFEALSTAAEPANLIIPIVEEQLEVGRRTVETGKIRLEKTVEEFQTALNEPLAVRTYDVERILKNEPVDAAPPVREEAGRTIYSLVEERLILTKQLVLREEVHLIRRDTQKIDTQVVTLKREHLVVEREDLTKRTP